MKNSLKQLRKNIPILILNLKTPYEKYRNSTLLTILAIALCIAAAYSTNQTQLLFQAPLLALSTILSLTAIYATINLSINFVRMIIFIRPKHPIQHIFLNLKRFFNQRLKLINLIYILIIFSAFAAAFSIIKSLIYPINGFKWDATFRSLDALIFFGTAPHEHLAWLFSTPESALLIETLYQLWFYIYCVSIVYVGYHLAHSSLSQQYLLASVLTWLLGGNLLAIIFSSAGPIFPEIHRLETYDNHLELIRQSSLHLESFALTVKEKLLHGLNGSGFTSISAFPSMHVASTTLMALLCRRLNPKLYVASVFYLLAIIIGSVALLWHYLVDSIVGFLLAIFLWRLAGWSPIAERRHEQ